MNIKPAWNTKPDMFEGSISNITPQTQQSPLEEVGNGASHSIIEALEEHTVPLFNNNPLHGAMAEMVGGCPVEIRRSVIEKATQYGEADDNALYGLAVFDLYNEHLQPTGAVFTNPTIKGFKDIVFGHGGLYFNRSKLNELPLIVTDDIHLAFKTAYPIYAPYQSDKINAYTLKILMQAHADLCVIAPVHQQDAIQRRYSGMDVKMAFIPEPPNIAMLQDELDSMIKVAIDQAKSLAKGHLAKPFKIKEGEYLNILMDGLYLVKEHDDGEGGIKRTRTRISDSAIILGEARSLNNNNWKRVIQFNDKDNVQHTLLIPYEHFMGEAQEALKIIANHGLMPPRQPNKKNVFINYIQDYPIEKRFRCVDRTGWHGHSYVTPNKTYGDSSGEELLFNSEMKNPYAVHGSLAGWQELSRLIEPHALGVLAFSCAFSGQLVAPLNLESGGFHIYGSSTDGKSTITKAACSVWGNPREVSKQWRTTDNALENEAELRNDSFLNLDELRQAPPKAVSDIVYMLTGGQGKSRSSKTGKNRDSKQFNLMYTSTGEVTLEEHLRRGGIELDAGLLLRFAHIPSDAGKGYGVFEQINYGSRPQDIGNQINELSSKHYGHAGVKWLEYLTHDKGAVIQTALSQIDDFIQRCSKNIGKKLNGQSNRVLRRFALVAVSGELATKAGITGWQEGRAFNAVEQCFKTWLDGFGTGDNLEENKILEHFKIFIETHGSSRFENLIVSRHQDGEPMTPRINNRVGYYDPDSKMYLVSSAMFKSEMCTGLNESNAKKVLKKYGWIDCAEDGRYVKKVSKVLPGGGRPSLIHFKADVIQNFDE
ncbi:DUF927 domain-containing protein [Acinetobacter baumannii]|uniref:DUF927 domain-containing protein n=1 Tax=Acinetobacter baumannii TaxID=470 RepID=UPI0007074268|nr:DUF927 domain-containing protein [Acinetobacter baumannii]EKT8991007.1 DUF927 domain-containing protein [Acinetobacter baumannii]EKU0552839.1 DUF927 domain-containing protein [Acinetobacter baumannii]EKU0679206.1 DUF927 domain-containing protein [Acinetobacter baumannii]EKU0682534.1 DUF927 domain-containing protein [Acinetobacter baumannii]EKU0703524.1 DUF927 domain-containing protein [Acinetobacter baumannii]